MRINSMKATANTMSTSVSGIRVGTMRVMIPTVVPSISPKQGLESPLLVRQRKCTMPIGGVHAHELLNALALPAHLPTRAVSVGIRAVMLPLLLSEPLPPDWPPINILSIAVASPGALIPHTHPTRRAINPTEAAILLPQQRVQRPLVLPQKRSMTIGLARGPAPPPLVARIVATATMRCLASAPPGQLHTEPVPIAAQVSSATGDLHQLPQTTPPTSPAMQRLASAPPGLPHTAPAPTAARASSVVAAPPLHHPHPPPPLPRTSSAT